MTKNKSELSCLCCSGRGQEAVTALGAEGLKPMFYQLDINDSNSIIASAAYFQEKYGGVDVLINNAGIAFKGKTQRKKIQSKSLTLKSDRKLFLSPVADTTPFAEQAEVTLKTNFFATRDMLTHFLPLIKAGGEFRTF